MNYLDRLKSFIEKKSSKQKLVVIYWPTACGKTSLSIEVAKNLKTEVVSVDSRQIFKYMNIWTAKIKEDEKEGIIHHMIDIVSPDENYSIWLYKKEAEKIIEKLFFQNKIPVLAWGTGLYIDSLIYDFDIPEVVADLEFRKVLEEEAEKYWKEFVYKKLQEIDPEYAKELHPNNLNYVIRAIEIKTLTWKSKADFRIDKVLKYDVLFLTPYDENRRELYNRINKRVDIMFEEGLLEEFENLLKMWFNQKSFWMKSIWYTELFDYINKKSSLEDTKELIKKNSRNYAKRQLTWFRRYEK